MIQSPWLIQLGALNKHWSVQYNNSKRSNLDSKKVLTEIALTAVLNRHKTYLSMQKLPRTNSNLAFWTFCGYSVKYCMPWLNVWPAVLISLGSMVTTCYRKNLLALRSATRTIFIITFLKVGAGRDHKYCYETKLVNVKIGMKRTWSSASLRRHKEIDQYFKFNFAENRCKYQWIGLLFKYSVLDYY